MIHAVLGRALRAWFTTSVLAAGLLTSPAHAEGAPIRVAFPAGMNGQVCVVMEKAGIARKNGLDAQFTAFQNGPPMMEALVAGSIDAVVTSLMPVTTYAAKAPGDVKVVAMLGQSSYALMVAKDSPVQGENDLVGRSLGLSFGSDSHLDAAIWLKQAGLHERVKLVNIAPSELATALANQSVDAIVIRQPQVRRLQEQSGARIIRSWPFRFLSIVKTSFIAGNPTAYARYLDALRETLDYVARNPEQSSAWFGEHLRVDPGLIARVAQDDAALSGSGRADAVVPVDAASRALIERWMADAHEHKMIRTKVDGTALFP
jgi:ABC-type nitrate/sulfonate/bicarbonate transport system substrate-binding protein